MVHIPSVTTTDASRTFDVRTSLASRAAAALLALLLSPPSAHGFPWAPPDGFAGDPPDFNDCTACHSDFGLNTGDGVLEIQGMPFAYAPGETYALSVRLDDRGQSRWGFEMTVIDSGGLQAGVMAPEDEVIVSVSEGPGSERDYAKQTIDGTYWGEEEGIWGILWTAPPEGSGAAFFYAAGNAANGDDTPSQDYIYAVDVFVPEGIPSAARGAAVAGLLEATAFPNPSAGSGRLRLRLPEATALRVRVVDAAGRHVARLADGPAASGDHLLSWDGRDSRGRPVASGVYYYVLDLPGARRAVPLRILR